MYNTLGNDSGRYAYRFPPTLNATPLNMNTNNTCVSINANPGTENNFRRMDCEMDLENDPSSSPAEINYFKTYGFTYYIFYEGQSSGSASSSIGGGTVGTSTEYSGGSQGSVYYYKVISCGAGFSWDGSRDPAVLNQMQTIEARIKLEQ
jgi:hypothetical protein